MWLDVEFLVMLLAVFHWKINAMNGTRISGNDAGWIYLEINLIAGSGISGHSTG